MSRDLLFPPTSSIPPSALRSTWRSIPTLDRTCSSLPHATSRFPSRTVRVQARAGIAVVGRAVVVIHFVLALPFTLVNPSRAAAIGTALRLSITFVVDMPAVAAAAVERQTDRTARVTTRGFRQAKRERRIAIGNDAAVLVPRRITLVVIRPAVGSRVANRFRFRIVIRVEPIVTTAVTVGMNIEFVACQVRVDISLGVGREIAAQPHGKTRIAVRAAVPAQVDGRLRAIPGVVIALLVFRGQRQIVVGRTAPATTQRDPGTARDIGRLAVRRCGRDVPVDRGGTV